MGENKKRSSSATSGSSSLKDIMKSLAYFPSSSYTPTCAGPANMTQRRCAHCQMLVSFYNGYVTWVKDYYERYFCNFDCKENFITAKESKDEQKEKSD